MMHPNQGVLKPHHDEIVAAAADSTTTYADLGRRYGVNPNSIRNYCERHKIEWRMDLKRDALRRWIGEREAGKYAHVDRDAVAEDVRAGMPYKQIIKKHDIPVSSIDAAYRWILMVARSRGVPPRTKPLKPAAEREAIALKMIEDRASIQEIMRTAHISRRVIKRDFGYDGWTAQECVQHALSVRYLNRDIDQIWAKQGVDIR